MAKTKTVMVRLNCTYNNGKEDLAPGAVVEMDEADAERFAERGLVTIPKHAAAPEKAAAPEPEKTGATGRSKEKP